jgi:TATA-box binding protein (TBP) (component of TFIID and TFIIIB)
MLHCLIFQITFLAFIVNMENIVLVSNAIAYIRIILICHHNCVFYYYIDKGIKSCCSNHYFPRMEIVNINYKGRVVCNLSDLEFPKNMSPPQQLVYCCKAGEKLLVFSSGKCRLMGCRKAITSTHDFPIPIILTDITCMTLVMNLYVGVNLIQLANKLGSRKCMFEPEIFPALRLTQFNPLCVNVFASGKIVILGLKHLKYKYLYDSIRHVIFD